MARGRRVLSPLWSDVHGLLNMRLSNAAAVLRISPKHLTLLCRRNGLPRWPGKKIRSLNAKLEKLTQEATVVREGALPGAAAGRPLEIRKVHEDLIAVHAQIRRPDAEMPEYGGGEIINLLGNVGVPDGSGSNN